MKTEQRTRLEALQKQLYLARAAPELTAVKETLELMLQDVKDRIIVAPSVDAMRAFQGEASALTRLLIMLSQGRSELPNTGEA